MKYSNPDIESSYRIHDIGRTLYDTVLKKKPKKIIEFGCLYGYSTVAMAMALHEIGSGEIMVYDLWEKYPHKHSTKDITENNINRYGLADYVHLVEKDFFQWINKPEFFDLLHVDISNKGDTIEMLYDKTRSEIENGAIVLFEGGTQERDNVEWMKKYGAKKIVGCKAPFEVIRFEYPGLSWLLIE